jgi:erythromycin esterase
MIGNARVVALGEATHGTHEFFQLKHRMLEFLVSEMNFNVFAIEANMPEGFDLNEYVLNGKGDPERLLSGLYFWTWDTEEVLRLIRWMRQYNADERHQRKVKFYGFDMQAPVRPVKVALAYLRRIDESESRRLGAILAVAANPFTASTYDTLPEARRGEIAAAAHALVAALDQHPGGLEWRIARQHARIAEQGLTSPGRNNIIGNAQRARSCDG